MLLPGTPGCTLEALLTWSTPGSVANSATAPQVSERLSTAGDFYFSLGDVALTLLLSNSLDYFQMFLPAFLQVAHDQQQRWEVLEKLEQIPLKIRPHADQEQIIKYALTSGANPRFKPLRLTACNSQV